MDKKLNQTIFFLQETHSKYLDTDRLEVDGWRRKYHANTNRKKFGIAYLFQTKKT